jgi:hypothetical protein
MNIEHCVQGTQDWFDARNGRVTASRIKDVMAYLKQTKAEETAGIRREAQKRIDYRTEIIAETLLGEALPHFVSDAMKWGIEQEALAATEYEIESPEDVSGVGFVYHPSIERAGASPDRLVGSDGLLEVKCPNTTTHIAWIKAGVVPEEHIPQMYFQMRCCERQWCDFMSFDSRLPKRYQKFIRRLYADEAIMNAIDTEVLKFLAEVDADLAELNLAMPEQQQPEADPDDSLGAITDDDIAWAQQNL